MSGTSSRTSDSLSSLGSFSMSSWVRTSISSESPARSLVAEHLLGQLGHPLLVGPGEDDAAPAVLELLLEGDHLAVHLAVAHQHHVERLVEHHLVALADDARVDVGVQADPHLAARREDVDRAVLVDAQEGAVGGRGLGQLLDLLAQGGQLLLGLLEGEGQLLVLRGGVGQLALGLEQALLEGLDPARALLEPATERVDLILGVGQLGTQCLGLAGFVSGRGTGHCSHPSPRPTPDLPHVAACPRPCTEGVGGGEYAWRGLRAVMLTACVAPHVRSLRPSGGCDRGERRRHEGLDRPGSLHRGRTVRGDRAGRVHPSRRRPGLREGSRQGQERPGRLGRHGRRAQRSRRGCRRGLRGVPRASASSSSATSARPACPSAPAIALQPSNRRAVVRNPVWPTMRWSGRTERASTCQVRRMISCVSASPKGTSSSSSVWRSSAVWLMVGR